MIFENVEAYCREHGLSISGFEKLCGIGNGVVSAWKGESSPTLTSVMKIADATGIPASEWLKDKEKETV